jgi:hypothetical protein
MLLAVAILGVIIWALVDVVRRPGEAFATIGSRRFLWIGLLLLAFLGPPILGAGLAGWYLVRVRPKVAAAAQAALPPADPR